MNHVIWKDCQEDMKRRAANKSLCEIVLQKDELLLPSDVLRGMMDSWRAWDHVINSSVCPTVSMGNTPERHKIIGTVVHERSFGPKDKKVR